MQQILPLDSVSLLHPLYLSNSLQLLGQFPLTSSALSPQRKTDEAQGAVGTEIDVSQTAPCCSPQTVLTNELVLQRG